MSTIKYTNTDGYPTVKVKATGRIGRVVDAHPVQDIGTMLELAFTDDPQQFWTECYWSTETEPVISSPAPQGTLF
jgi:hypothetical protein